MGGKIGLEILFVGSILCLCVQLMQRVFITHVYQKRNTICSLAACLNLHQLSDIYCVYKQVVKPTANVGFYEKEVFCEAGKEKRLLF